MVLSLFFIFSLSVFLRGRGHVYGDTFAHTAAEYLTAAGKVFTAVRRSALGRAHSCFAGVAGKYVSGSRTPVGSA